MSQGGDTLVATFIASVRSDLDSPITSNFGSKINDYRIQAQRITDEIDADACYFERMRRISRDVETAMTTVSKQILAFCVVTKELAEKWASRPDTEPANAAAALLKMELFLKGEAELMNGQVRNWSNNIVHPLDLLCAAPNDIRNKAVDKACREYEAKFIKAESDARRHAKQSGYTRSQPTHGELAEQLTRERLSVQQELCKFLLGMDAVHDKSGPQLLRHFIELFRCQNEYYMDGLKTSEHFRRDLEKLEERMAFQNADRCQQRNALFDLKNRLEASGGLVRTISTRRMPSRKDHNRESKRISALDPSTESTANSVGLGSVTAIENDSNHDKLTGSTSSLRGEIALSGFLYKKSNKKLHKQWQKRKCQIKDGHFWLFHSDEAITPAKISLLISDCKPSSEDAKIFDLYCRDRTYHFQAESESDAKRWVVALKQEITRVKKQMLSNEFPHEGEGAANSASTEWLQRKLCVQAVCRLPGNQECADCSSTEDVQWLSNTGALVCIACSGVHRELGVHVSRIQSLVFDVISPVEFLVPLATGNSSVNRLFEHEEALCALWKPRSGCTRSDRQKFIQFKYRDRSYIEKVVDADALFCDATRELDVEKAYRALLSPHLTPLPFEAHGPFYQMIRNGGSMALPIAQLVIQLRIDLPGLESMLTECIQSGRADILAVLLHSRSVNTAFSINPLETLAIKLGQEKIAEMLRLVRTNERAHLNYVAIPTSLFMPSPGSGSLSRSSSSVSPMPALSEGDDSTVNVLMRDGTTVAVSRGSHNESFVCSTHSRRSESPADASQRPCSAYASHAPSLPVASSFKGTSFGKNLEESSSRHSVHLTLHQQLDDPVSEKMDANKNFTQTAPSSSVSSFNVSLRTQNPAGSAASSNGSSPKQLHTEESISSADVTLTDTVPFQITISNPQKRIFAAPNHYTKPPAPSTTQIPIPVPSASDENTLTPSSVPSSPTDNALPSYPHPKPYHRSSSEHHQTVADVGGVRDIREENSASACSANRINISNMERELREGPRIKPVGGVSTPFTIASTSLSLDPIPIVRPRSKEENVYVRLPGNENEQTTSVTEKRNRLANARGINNSEPSNRANDDCSLNAEVQGMNKPIFSSFDNARASFMTPGERARFSNSVKQCAGPSANDAIVFSSSDDACIESGSMQLKKSKIAKPRPAIPAPSTIRLKPPIPAPRRNLGTGEQPQKECVRRCRALYDCVADNPDELSFRQGEVIIVSRERVDGENDTWMEGYVASDPQRRGVFPVTFVTFQS